MGMRFTAEIYASKLPSDGTRAQGLETARVELDKVVICSPFGYLWRF